MVGVATPLAPLGSASRKHARDWGLHGGTSHQGAPRARRACLSVYAAAVSLCRSRMAGRMSASSWSPTTKLFPRLSLCVRVCAPRGVGAATGDVDAPVHAHTRACRQQRGCCATPWRTRVGWQGTGNSAAATRGGLLEEAVRDDVVHPGAACDGGDLRGGSAPQLPGQNGKTWSCTLPPTRTARAKATFRRLEHRHEAAALCF